MNRASVRAALRGGDGPDARRRQLARPRVSSRGRLAALHRARRRPVSRRRRRQPLPRLRPLLGAAHPRPCASASRRCARRGVAQGDELRRAQPARARARSPHSASDAEPRARPVRQLRDRGHDERAARRAGVHGAVEDRQVRRVLPRPRGSAPRAGGIGCRDARASRLSRSHGRRCRRHAHRAVQRPRGGRDALRRARRHRGGDRRAGRREHGPRPSRAGFPPGAAQGHRRARRPARLRRGDDRVPRASGRSAGALRRHARPDDARQGDRRRPPGGGVRRSPRDHGARGSGRRRVPGGDAVGEPARDDRGDRDLARDRRAGRLGWTGARRRAARGGSLGARCRDPGRARRNDVRHVLLGRARHELGHGRTGRYRPLRRVSPRDARARRSISLRRSSKPASCRRFTATPRSTRRSPQLRTRSPVSEPRVYASRP